MNTDEKRQWWLDEQIRRIIGDGNVAHLPNAGKPFDWENPNPYEDPNMEMAHKIMRENEVVPEWVEMAQFLDHSYAKIMRLIPRFAQDYQQRLYHAQKTGSMVQLKEAEDRWQSAKQRLRDMVDEYNSQLLTWNIMKPAQVAQKIPIRLDEEWAKLGL